MKMKTNGIELHYTVEGEGPWMTLSHSLACDSSMWDPQMALLTKRFKVLRFDTRGHGQSDAPDADYTLDQMADDVHGLLTGLGITKTHWMGLSMGGMIGQAYALKHPGMFASMVLADTTSRRPPNAAAMWGERMQIARTKGMEGLVEPTLSPGPPGRDGQDRQSDPQHAGGRLCRLLCGDCANRLYRAPEGNQMPGAGAGG